MFARQKGIETELNNQRGKINEVETVIVKNVTQSNRVVEDELSRFEKIISAFEKYLDKQISDIKTHVQQYLDEQKDTKNEAIEELLAKYEDLESSVSVLSSNITKQQEDAQDRHQILKDDIKNTENVLNRQIEILENKVTADEQSLSKRV